MSASTHTRLSSQLTEAIAAAEWISFDIFETLVWRVYAEPVDLFKHLEAAMDIPGFAEQRMGAEQDARRLARDEGRHEVTLDDIYNELSPTLARVRQAEIDLEVASCRCDPIILAAYRHALQLGKRVVFASDMYLPLPVIERILSNAGYDRRNHLFLSSVEHRPKATGAMFDDIVAYAGVPAKDILHIGDNYHSDYRMPLEHGLRAFHYVSALEVAGAVPEAAVFTKLDTPPYAAHPASSLIKGLIAHYNLQSKAGEADYWEHFGFVYGGPIALSYAGWIRQQVEDLDIDRVFFMARDGYAIHSVYNRLYPDDAGTYLFASRRCYLLAALKSVDGEFLDNVVPDGVVVGHMAAWSYRDFLEQLALDDPKLEAAYAAAFPELDQTVTTQDQLDTIRAFFRANAPSLLAVGAAERDVLLRYFDSAGLFDGKAAVVDLGWKGTLFKSLRRVCQAAGQTIHPVGLYFATHNAGTRLPQILCCALDHGRPTDSVLNTNQAVLLLEMMFSAPHPSIIKVVGDGDAFRPLYQDASADEPTRLAQLAAMHRGIMKFVDAYTAVTRKHPLPIPGPISVGPLHALCDSMSREDRRQLSSVSYATGIGNVGRREQLCQPVEGKRFGLVTPWPGTRCAEYELMLRIGRAADNIGAKAVMLSDQGYVLSRQVEHTGEVVDPYSLNFVISLHYYAAPLIDSFHYLTLWNPPEIPTHDANYPRLAEHYLMYDDYLTAHSPRIEHHLRTLLINSPRQLDGMSELLTSFPLDVMMEPNLDNPTLFYCGMNWEKKVYATGARHEGLLKLLDRTGQIKFFGPNRIADWGDVLPWEGYDCYQYPIPFDGFSIVEEINKCGVVLVMSSNDHRRSGMVTTRLYEACAGGAVIISDDNPFVVRHFSDAALFVEFNAANPEETFRQIMAKLAWIKDNPAEALALATRAQEIFRAKFSIEMQLERIFAAHDEREQAVAASLYARNGGTVLVSYIVDALTLDQDQKARLARVMDNVARQTHARLTLAVTCDKRVEAKLRHFVSATAGTLDVRVFVTDLFSRTGTRLATSGVVHQLAQQDIAHDYLMFAGPHETWYRVHVTTLQRVLEDRKDAVAATSGRTTELRNRSRTLRNFSPIRLDNLLNCVDVTPGEVLFKREVEDFAPPFANEFVDGLEHYFYLLLAELQFDRETVFSKKATLSIVDHLPGPTMPTFKHASQVAMFRDMFHYKIEARRARSIVFNPAPPAEAGGSSALTDAALAARTAELLQVRADLVVRIDQVETLMRDISARDADLTYVRAELEERTRLLEEVQELLIARTQQAETLHHDLDERNVEVIELRRRMEAVAEVERRS